MIRNAIPALYRRKLEKRPSNATVGNVPLEAEVFGGRHLDRYVVFGKLLDGYGCAFTE